MDRPDVKEEKEVTEAQDEKKEPQVHNLEVQDGVVGAESDFS
jgi:hypothetical protein